VVELVSVTAVFEWLKIHFAPCTVLFSCAGQSVKDSPYRLVCYQSNDRSTMERYCPICKTHKVARCPVCTMESTCQGCIKNKMHLSSCAETFMTLKKAFKERVRLLATGTELVCQKTWISKRAKGASKSEL
jgi:hypothetical protein